LVKHDPSQLVELYLVGGVLQRVSSNHEDVQLNAGSEVASDVPLGVLILRVEALDSLEVAVKQMPIIVQLLEACGMAEGLVKDEPRSEKDAVCDAFSVKNMCDELLSSSHIFDFIYIHMQHLLNRVDILGICSKPTKPYDPVASLELLLLKHLVTQSLAFGFDPEELFNGLEVWEAKEVVECIDDAVPSCLILIT
jgi:hypothetical protein